MWLATLRGHPRQEAWDLPLHVLVSARADAQRRLYIISPSLSPHRVHPLPRSFLLCERHFTTADLGRACAVNVQNLPVGGGRFSFLTSLKISFLVPVVHPRGRRGFTRTVFGSHPSYPLNPSENQRYKSSTNQRFLPPFISKHTYVCRSTYVVPPAHLVFGRK